MDEDFQSTPIDTSPARDFKIEFEEYLETLDSPKVHSLAELIQFNKDHAEKELPTSMCTLLSV